MTGFVIRNPVLWSSEILQYLKIHQSPTRGLCNLVTRFMFSKQKPWKIETNYHLWSVGCWYLSNCKQNDFLKPFWSSGPVVESSCSPRWRPDLPSPHCPAHKSSVTPVSEDSVLSSVFHRHLHASVAHTYTQMWAHTLNLKNKN